MVKFANCGGRNRTCGLVRPPSTAVPEATNFYQQKLPRNGKRDGWDSNPRAGA
jgi:hypothetical protein